MIKLLVTLTLLFSLLNSQKVYIAKKNISYKEAITKNNIELSNVSNIPHRCVPLTFLNSDNLISKNYIKKGKVICKKSLKKEIKDIITYDFGSIQITRNIKILKDGNRYIKIRNSNGKIEKIDKIGY